MSDLEPLLVLDAHGVVFTNPFPAFVREVATRAGLDADATWLRWRRDLRVPFWSGQLSRRGLWNEVAPGLDHDDLESALEARYRAGPAFVSLSQHAGPVWLLTNHRTEWLLPRLARFGIEGRFERLLVSDQWGTVKPSASAFEPLVEQASRRAVTFVDDSRVNIEAADQLGLHAVHVTSFARPRAFDQLDPDAGHPGVHPVPQP